jgi:bifunctional non-homologous end joining protein LigD
MRACLSRQGAPEAFLYASDVLELDGHDLRHESWEGRRAVLVQLLANADEGIRLCEHIEDVDGAVVFRQACVMGLEGIVAKRRDSRYHSGRSRDCRIVVAGHRAYGWGCGAPIRMTAERQSG